MKSRIAAAKTLTLLSGATFALMTSAASAQDRSAPANFEEVALTSGFSPDPYTVDVVSGGLVEAETVNNSCRGMISNAPDVRLNFTAGSGILPLILTTASDHDLTMVVNAPDGRWYCNDDSGDSLNPLLRFDDPLSGSYEIWIGTYAGSANHSARLIITELESRASGNANPTMQVPARQSGATYEDVQLSAGFSPDPYIVRLSSGGGRHASEMGSDCSGYIASAPDVTLDYSAGSFPLYLSVNSMADTTLVVRAPNGGIYCDDDSGERLNPSVRFQTPLSGQYEIWVGTFGSSELHSAELNISELYSQ